MTENSGEEWEPWQDLSESTENEILENIAQNMVKRDLGLLSLMVLDSGGRLIDLWSALAMGLFFPYLEFLGLDRYTVFFRKYENRDRLIKRIEELNEEKKRKKS